MSDDIVFQGELVLSPPGLKSLSAGTIKNTFQSWKKRWCLLRVREGTPVLEWWDSAKLTTKKGEMELRSDVVDFESEVGVGKRRFVFLLQSPERKLFCQCNEEADYSRWIEEVQGALNGVEFFNMNYEDGEADDGAEPMLGLAEDPFGGADEPSTFRQGPVSLSSLREMEGEDEVHEDDFGFGFLESDEFTTAMSRFVVDEHVRQFESPEQFQRTYPDMIVCMAVANDGKVAYTASASTIKLWSIKDRRFLRDLYSAKAGHITMCATNAAGKYVVFSEARNDRGGKHQLLVYNASNSTAPMVTVPEPHGDSEVTCCSVNTAGNHFVTGAKNHTICLWDTANPSAALCEFEGHLGAINSVEFVFGDVVVSSCSNGDLCLWNMASMELVNELPGHAAVFQPWRTWVLPSFEGAKSSVGTVAVDGSVKLWDLSSGECRIEKKGHPNIRIQTCMLSSDGLRLLVKCGTSKDKNNILCMLDTPSGEAMWSSRHESHFIWSDRHQCVFLPNDKVASIDGQNIRVFDGSSGAMLQMYDHEHVLTTVAMHANPVTREWTVLVGDVNGSVIFPEFD